MRKLKIIKIDNYNYELQDSNNKIYNLILEFMDINVFPKVNDYLYISKNLLDKKYKEYSIMYSFGSLDSEYGRKIDKDSPDIIGLESDNNIIYLKRLYG